MRRMYSINELKTIISEVIGKSDKLFDGALWQDSDGTFKFEYTAFFNDGALFVGDVDFERANIDGLTPSKCGLNVIELEGTSGTLSEEQQEIPLNEYSKIKVDGNIYSASYMDELDFYASYFDLTSLTLSELYINKQTHVWEITSKIVAEATH